MEICARGEWCSYCWEHCRGKNMNRPRAILLLSILLVTGILAGWLIQLKSPFPLLLDLGAWGLTFCSLVLELRRPS
jgi:hypothetical protein